MDLRTVRLFSWNVNGARAIARKGFAAWLAGCGGDIVMLQETKAAPEQLPAEIARPPGFQSAWCAAERPGYSGVATLSRFRMEVALGMGEQRFDSEGRVLISTYPGLTVFNTYFPSGSSGAERVAFKLAFYERYLTLLRGYLAAGRRIIVAGDVNTAYAEIDLARPRENRQTSGFLPEERAALGAYFAAGLVDTFRHVRPAERRYSWWSQVTNARERDVGWRLDYLLVSRNLVDHIADAEIHGDVTGSDHCPVSLTLQVPATWIGAPA